MRILAIALLLQISGCTSMLFHPMEPHVITPNRLGIDYEDIYISTEDGIQLHGWKLLSAIDPSGTILYFHGNAENISTHFTNVYWLTRFGYDVYLFDYRGYGQSEGETDLDGTIQDMELMIGHTVKRLVEDEKLIVMGHSLGGSMSIYVTANSAYRNQIEALITVEAFSDYHDVTQEVLARSWLLWLFQWPLSFTIDNSYRPLDEVASIAPIPIAIIHSKSDEIIDFYHAEKLYEAASSPKELIVIDSNHSNVFISKDNRQILFDYLKTLR